MSYWKPVAILFAIVSLLIFTALTINFILPSGDRSRTRTASDSPSEVRSKYVDLGEFLINLDSEYGSQYVKTSISLKLDKSGAPLELEARVPEIRHHVNLVLQSQTAAELSTHEGKLKLADAIRKHVEYVMGLRKTLPAEGVAAKPIKLGAVSDVLFTSFIIH